MAIIYNGTQLTNIKFGDTNLKEVWVNDTSTTCCTLVWTDVDYYLDLIENTMCSQIALSATCTYQCFNVCLPVVTAQVARNSSGSCLTNVVLDCNPYYVCSRIESYNSGITAICFVVVNEPIATVQRFMLVCGNYSCCRVTGITSADERVQCLYSWVPYFRNCIFYELLRCNGY